MVPQLYLVYLPTPQRRASPTLAANLRPLRSLRPPLVPRLLLALLHLHPHRRARLRRVPPQHPLRHPNNHRRHPPQRRPCPHLHLPLNHEARGLTLSPDGHHLASTPRPKAPRHLPPADRPLGPSTSTGPTTRPSAPTPARNLTAKLAYEWAPASAETTPPPEAAAATPCSGPQTPPTSSDIAGHRGSALLLSVDATSGAVDRTNPRQTSRHKVSAPLPTPPN